MTKHVNIARKTLLDGADQSYEVISKCQIDALISSNSSYISCIKSYKGDPSDIDLLITKSAMVCTHTDQPLYEI